MMSGRLKSVLLSRFFRDNVRLVADMCPKCYEECTDVQIIGANITFLRKTNKFSEEIKRLVFNFRQLTSEDDKKFFGFNQQNLAASLECLGKMNEIVNARTKIIEEMENRNNDSFLGFSMDDIKQSCRDYKQVIESCHQIKNQIYRDANLRIINICKRRNKKMKQKSKYFQNVKKEVYVSKYFTPQVLKSEEIVKNNAETLEDCKNVKPEPPTDFEKTYFKSLDNQIYPAIKTETNDICSGTQCWVPPKSPHNLIEEVLYHDPWALLIATIFLNRTTCMNARPFVFWFLAENPNPLTVLDRYPEELEKYFVNLGLQKTRAVQVWRMSHDFVFKNWKRVSELYGIGNYGENAFRMFCLGDFNVEPKDRFLRIYKAWYQKIQMKMEPT